MGKHTWQEIQNWASLSSGGGAHRCRGSYRSPGAALDGEAKWRV